MKIKSNMHCNSGFNGKNSGKLSGAPRLVIPAGATLWVDDATWELFKDVKAIKEGVAEKSIELIPDQVVVEDEDEALVAPDKFILMTSEAMADEIDSI